MLNLTILDLLKICKILKFNKTILVKINNICDIIKTLLNLHLQPMNLIINKMQQKINNNNNNQVLIA